MKENTQSPPAEADEVTTFLKTCQQNHESSEERLRACLLYMQQTLAREGAPDFKGFWQVRQFCFPLFKESFAHHSRAQLWELYTDLTREGRRLKSLLEAESSFAAEQIGLALQDLEQQVETLVKVQESQKASSAPKVPQALKNAAQFYADKQQILDTLNVVAARIHGLRKELIKTQMRMKQKNGLFSRLSLLGDIVFPQRKQLMKEVSEQFSQDVTHFAEEHFSEQNFCSEKVRRQVFFFRDEIKVFQSLAKVLTLDNQAFMNTRNTLSQCWDQLKGMEKELNKEFAEHKQQSAQHAEEIIKQIKAIGERFTEGQMTADEGLHELAAAQQSMRQVTLVKQDVHLLKDLIAQVSQPMHQQKQQVQQQKRQQEEAVELERKQKVQDLQQEIVTCLQNIPTGVLAQLQEQLVSLRQRFASLVCLKSERHVLDALLKQVKDALMEKQEAAVLNLPHESRQVLEELNQILQVRKERRREIKSQLDEYRKMLAGSSLDLEKVITTQELLDQEKEALEKCDGSIVEIEKKIQDLKHRS